jgi:hypothetical protein
MAVNTYDKGDSVRLKCTFTVNSVNTDPTTITLRVKDSDGTIAVYTYAGGTITKSAVGIYYKDVTVSNDGIWYWRYEGTGTVIAAGESSFIVRPSEF